MKVCACGCGVEFTPRKSTGVYATDNCRLRANRAKHKREADGEQIRQASGIAAVVAIGARGSRASAGRRSAVAGRRAAATGSKGVGKADQPGPIEAQLIAELGDAGKTSLGLQARALASRMDDAGTTASAMYSLSRQLVVLTAAALRDQVPDVEVDPVAAVQAQVIEMRREFARRQSAG